MGFQSLFARVNDADSENNSTVLYLTGFVACGAGMGIPIAAIVIGAMFLGECPFNSSIPIFLILCGSAFTTMVLLSMCALVSLVGFVSGFSAVFQITLAIQVLPKYHPEYFNRDDENYCNQVLYLYSFAYSTLFCVLLIVSVIYWISRKCKEKCNIR